MTMRTSMKTWLSHNWVKLTLGACFIGVFIYCLFVTGQIVCSLLISAASTFLLFLMLGLVVVLLPMLFSKEGRELLLEEPSPSYEQRQIWERNEEWLRKHADEEYDDDADDWDDDLDDDDLDDDPWDDDTRKSSKSDDIVYGVALGVGMYMSGLLGNSGNSGDSGDGGVC